MESIQQLQPAHQLQHLVNAIQKEHYGAISFLCVDISKQIASLKAGGLSWESSGYVTISEEVTGIIKEHLVQHAILFLPYIQELAQKDAAGHDCSTCSGTCAMQHGKKIMDLNTQMHQLKQNIKGPMQVAQHIFDAVETDDLLVLHHKMTLLYGMVATLIRIEEEQVLPGIMQAQKNMYAGGR